MCSAVFGTGVRSIKIWKTYILGLTLIPIILEIVDVTVPFIITCAGFTGIAKYKIWVGMFYKEVLLRLPFTCVVPMMFVTITWNV